MRLLKSKRIFFGISLTVTSENMDLVTSEAFIRELQDRGCRLFFYVEFIPVREGTQDLVVSPKQREELDRRIWTLRRSLTSVFISFPGDEKSYGGCLAA